MNAPNSNIIDVSCSFTEQGLLAITFVCKGTPEFPTAKNLAFKDAFRDVAPNAKAWDIYGDLTLIFRNGASTQNLLPKYSYENGQIIWTCTSLCLQDGSAYFSDCRELDSKNYPYKSDERYRISSANYTLDGTLPLVYVSFTGVGDKPIYPTALNENFSANDKITDAFYGGEVSTMLQCSWQRNDERVGWVWTATTVLHLDNTPYFPNVERGINDTDKLRIFDVSCRTDTETSLMYVSFTGVGTVNNNAIFPTAGSAGSSNPLDSFFGGAMSVSTSLEWKRNDERLGWIWTTTTVLNADGTALSDDSIKTLRQYTDVAEVPIVGKVDIDWDNGAVFSPPITHKIKVQVTIKLVPESMLTTANVSVPYYADKWAHFGATGSLEDGRLVTEVAGASGYLLNSITGVDVGTEGHTYKGAKTSGVFNVWGESSPSYSDYTGNIYTALLDSDISVLFTSIGGTKYYLLREVKGLGK